MATGYAPYLLRSISEIAGENDPQYKITPTGLLMACIESGQDVRPISLDSNGGQKRELKVKYKQRASVNAVQEEDNCDINLVPSYAEAEITAPRTAKVGIYVSIADLKRLTDEATQGVTLGAPATGFMREHVHSVMTSANAILQRIDQRLLGDITWGKHVATGNNAAVTVNFNDDNTVNLYSEGMTAILKSAFENEMYGELAIVGAGNFLAYEMQKRAAGLGSNGLDVSKFSGYKFFPDLYANSDSFWGSNVIGVFSKGSFGLVDVTKWRTPFTGRLGTSVLFQAGLPVSTNQNDGTVKNMTFDMQLKEIDCPTTLLNAYGEETIYDKGYALYISKEYGLFQIPSDAYRSDDRLTGNNGSLRFTITNS